MNPGVLVIVLKQTFGLGINSRYSSLVRELEKSYGIMSCLWDKTPKVSQLSG